MRGSLTESTVEEAALSWFGELGCVIMHGLEIAPGELHAELSGFGETVLAKRLRDALAALNPNIPVEALDDAFRKVTTTHHPSLIVNNRAFHKMLVDGGYESACVESDACYNPIEHLHDAQHREEGAVR